MGKYLEEFRQQLAGELRTGGGATLDELYNLVEVLLDEIDHLEGDIAALKIMTPCPRGFDSWEQFDKITKQASEQFGRVEGNTDNE